MLRDMGFRVTDVAASLTERAFVLGQEWRVVQDTEMVRYLAACVSARHPARRTCSRYRAPSG